MDEQETSTVRLYFMYLLVFSIPVVILFSFLLRKSFLKDWLGVAKKRIAKVLSEFKRKAFHMVIQHIITFRLEF
jgi:hypothetical protein